MRIQIQQEWFATLAPYYHKSGYENVTTAIDQALDVLSAMQNDTGGFSQQADRTVETVESCAQVLMTALCALGIDPETDPRFIKGVNGWWKICFPIIWVTVDLCM